MARIPEHELEQLKREVPLADVVQASGVTLKRHGENLLGHCPFHDDRSPSLVVTPSKNLWNCLGECGTGGTVIDWVMKAQRVSFRHAVEVLRSGSPAATAAPLAHTQKESTRVLLSPLASTDAEDQELLDQVVAYYHETLLSSPAALAYLKKRGLESPAVVEEHRLGFANRTLGYRLPLKDRKAGALLREKLTGLGVLRESGHEHFNGCLTVPIFDEEGRTVGLYGRKVRPQARKGAPVHLYLPGPHRGVWNLEAVQRFDEVILCESLLDALTFWEAGLRNVTASYGVCGFTDAHLAAFTTHRVKRVLIAYDRDDAGERAAQELGKKLTGAGLDVFRVRFPKGMDANEYAVKVKPAAKSLGLVVRRAEWWGKGKRPAVDLGADLDEPTSGPRTPTQESPTPAAPSTFSSLAAADEPTNGSRAPTQESPTSATSSNFSSLAAPDEPTSGSRAPRQRTVPSNGTDASDGGRSDPRPIDDPGEDVRTADAVAGAEVEAAKRKKLSAGTGMGDSRDRAFGRFEGSSEAAKEEKMGGGLAPGDVAREGEPAASPEPAAPTPGPAPEVRGDEVHLRYGERHWRVRGLGKNLSHEHLRVNVLVRQEEGDALPEEALRAAEEALKAFHVDVLDLYSARQRAGYVKEGARELGVTEEVLKRDLGRVLLELEALQEARIRETLTPKPQRVELTDQERQEALEFLRSPDLLDRILSDFDRCGVVGEETNKLVGYLAAVSRKLEEPLAVVVQSMSAAGKSALMEAVLAFVPREEQVKYSAMTGQSLFYMGQTNLKGKVLAIVEEEGAERASYALKLLQSEGELTIASTGKDPATGKLVTNEYRVEGPVAIFLTTTAIEVDEELLNRCLVLAVDEAREQTRAIHRLQRKSQTLEGLLRRRERDEVVRVHQNAQRLLRPLLVANPHAPALTFLDSTTRTRRDHGKYLTLIRSIALLHQYQRPVRTVEHQGRAVRYIEVSTQDIALANRLADEVLGRTLDELPPQTRRLLGLLEEMVSEACEELQLGRRDYRFTRRQVRERTGWGNTQLKVHLKRLEEHEYLMVHRGGRGLSFVYELAWDGRGEDGSPFLNGLIGADGVPGRSGHGDLRWSGTNAGWSGLEEEKSGSGRGQVGPRSGGCRGEGSPVLGASQEGSRGRDAKSPENTDPGEVHHRPPNGGDRTQVRTKATGANGGSRPS